MPQLRTFLLGLSVILAFPAFASEQQLIQQLKTFIAREEEGAIALLERSVNINSGSLNVEGVSKVGALFAEEFKRAGLETQWINGKPFARAGHLIARKPGSGTRILLIGHLDTVFEPNHPFQRAERVGAHILKGPGTADMKGGIVIGLVALRALQDANALGNLDITFVMHGDEEDVGEPAAAARADIIAAAKHADVAIGLENAANDPKTAVIARRSSSQWQLEVTGRSAHSSQIFSKDVGAGAAYELARILNGFYTELTGEEYLTFNPGVLLSGTNLDFDAVALSGTAAGKSNIITDRAVAVGDLRALTPQQIERAAARMQAIAAKSLPHTQAKLTFTHSYPPMAPTDGNRKLLSMYDEVSRTLGYGPVTAVDPARAGAADVSFAAAHVEMAIDGLGWLGGAAHTPDEFADLRNYKVQTERLALLLYRLGRE